jgi:hypothetical protein
MLEIIQKLKKRLLAGEKKKILDESGSVSEWIYSVLREETEDKNVFSRR